MIADTVCVTCIPLAHPFLFSFNTLFAEQHVEEFELGLGEKKSKKKERKTNQIKTNKQTNKKKNSLFGDVDASHNKHAVFTNQTLFPLSRS